MDNKEIAKEITISLLNRELIPVDAKPDEGKKGQKLPRWNAFVYQTILETLDRIKPDRKFAEVRTMV